MLRHKWEPAHGTIQESRIEQTTVQGKPGLHAVRVYVIDVRKVSGQALRATVKAPPGTTSELVAGTPVRVEVNTKTAEVRFDPHHPVGHSVSVRDTASVRDAVKLARELKGGMTGGAAGGIAATLAGLGEAAAAAAAAAQHPEAGTPGAHVVGGPQAAELMQALLSGGTDRAAALEKIRQIKSDMLAAASGAPGSVPDTGLPGARGMPGGPGMQGAPGMQGGLGQGQTAGGAPVQPVGFSSPEPPAAFPPVTSASAPATFSSPAATFGTPGAGPAGGSAGAPPSFSSPPTAPPAFNPVTPGAAGGTFGSFGGSSLDSFGQQSKADRIARLADQRDRGQLTPQQFEAQRQQIMDEI